MSAKSRYTIIVDNISSYTRSKDIRYEAERFGKVLAVERDARARCALVEFKSSRDAEKAWERLDGFLCEGRRWKVDWATRKDFAFFDWKWTEGPERSPSPSPSRSPSRSRSRSRSPSRGASPASKDEKADLAP